MNKYLKYIMFLLALLIFSACSMKKSTRDVELSKEDIPFTWWGDRTKNFGNSSYPISEKEIKEVVEDKYGLKLLPFFSEVRELVTAEFDRDGVTSTDEVSIIAQENSFRLTAENRFKDAQGEIIVNVRTIIEYEYYAKIGKVKVKNQDVDIRTTVTDDKFIGKDYNHFIEQLVELLNISNSEKSVKDFNKKNAEDPKQFAGQEVMIYTSKLKGEKEFTFGKNLYVRYNGDGIPHSIFVGTKDYRY